MALNEFQVYHEYDKLVDRGEATAMRCECGARFIPLVEDGTLVLWCPPDDYKMEQGAKMWYKIETTVNESLAKRGINV